MPPWLAAARIQPRLPPHHRPLTRHHRSNPKRAWFPPPDTTSHNTRLTDGKGHRQKFLRGTGGIGSSWRPSLEVLVMVFWN